MATRRPTKAKAIPTIIPETYEEGYEFTVPLKFRIIETDSSEYPYCLAAEDINVENGDLESFLAGYWLSKQGFEELIVLGNPELKKYYVQEKINKLEQEIKQLKQSIE